MDTEFSFLKLCGIWLAAWIASLSLSKVLMLATLIYTLAQLYFLLRDKWWRDRK